MSSNGDHRLVLGLSLLLLVDVLWVASSELTEYIFHQGQFNKPFFSTYLKTSLFMLYLPGFCFYKPWREQLSHFQRRRYTLLAETDAQEDEVDEDDEDEIQEDEIRSSLSNPVFLPIRAGGGDTDSEETEQCRRTVRFNRVTEVREMSGVDALHANLARLSYHASLRAQAALRRAANRLTVKEVATLGFSFSLLFFMGNFSYQTALSETEAGVVNVLSASSCLFTLILAALFPSNVSSDKFTLSKLTAVLFSLTGAVLVSYSDLNLETDKIPKGALWALGGALCYSSYIVFLRRKVDHEDKLDIPMFFGFVGLFNAFGLWPLFIALHLSKTEDFVWPNSEQWCFLIVNGIIGTVFSELLWLWGCFLTSSLIATLAIGLTIPLTMMADIFIKNIHYGLLFYMGAIPMFVSFFLVTILTHYEDWDPLMDFIKWIFSPFNRNYYINRRRNANYIFDRQERESLIESNTSQLNNHSAADADISDALNA